MTASSMESAMTSRETSEARMPSVPIEMPSEIAIVPNSNGVPPASRIPALTSSARARSEKLHGPRSVQGCTTATSGFSRSAGVRPVARSIARAGARAGPFLIASLFTFSLASIPNSSGPKKKAPRLRGGWLGCAS